MRQHKNIKDEKAHVWENGKIIVKCKQCGNHRQIKKSGILKSGNFCSRECYGIWRSKNMSGKNSPIWRGGPVEIKCKQCGISKKITPALIKKTGNFCSRKCHYIWVSQNKIGKNSYHWKAKLKKECLCCSKIFYVHFSLKNRKFCSNKCHGKWKSMNIIGKKHYRYKEKNIKCSFCYKIFHIYCCRKFKHQFCSKQCYTNWQRINHPRGKKNIGYKRIEIQCSYCKRIFFSRPCDRKYNLKFCSVECNRNYRQEHPTMMGRHHSNETIKKLSGINSPCWQGGISFEPYGVGFNKQLKKQIRQRDNYICQECKQTEKQLGYTLGVHHIDYNKKNNNINNLISLCRSCHCQTNYNRNDWTKYYNDIVGGLNVPS